MRKNIFFILAFATVLTSCTSLENPFTTTSTNIPLELQEDIAGKVNPEMDLYAMGKAKIDTSGSILAQSKANMRAKEILKEMIKKEVKANFKVFLDNSDDYSKKIVSPVLGELYNYTTDLCLKNANQKGAWENDTLVYSLFAIDKNKVADLSKQVFTDYLGDVSTKLTDIKQKINKININETPVENNQSKGNFVPETQEVVE